MAVVWSGSVITLQCSDWKLALGTDLPRALGGLKLETHCLEPVFRDQAQFVGLIEKLVSRVQYMYYQFKEKIMCVLKASVRQL